jgi:hypothetical protein
MGLSLHLLSSKPNRMSASALKVAQRFLGRLVLGQQKPKRMVILMGPPAAGKGFFTGEPEADQPGSKYGWKFPESTHGLFTSDMIPDHPEYDESDNHLRAIQFAESKKHFEALTKAHKKGPEAFEEALKDHWYETKDGDRVELSKVVSYDKFPEDHQAYFKTANRDFYVSMRGWHDDAKASNEETGKPRERFKDEARHRFDDSINEKIDKDNELLIVDSAGEDIDAQDYRGQIEKAKANGYEVTVVFLHPEQADTELSNLARGKVQGKRMVDQADIDNWYKQNKEALEEIQASAPDNFLHYRKPPPDPDPAKAAEIRKKARELMLALPPVPAKQDGEEDDAFKTRQKAWKKENGEAIKQITHTLYLAAPYPEDPDKRTSWGKTLDPKRVPKEPSGDVAATVEEMNQEADSRAGKAPESKVKPTGTPDEGNGKKPKKEDGKPKGKGKQDFLKAMRGKRVPNPNPESKAKYPDVLLVGMPWEYQKPYYEKWNKQQRAASDRFLAQKVAGRYMEASMDVVAAKPDFVEDLMTSIGKDIEAKLDVEGQFEVRLKKGPVLFVVVSGAEGDIATMKAIRPALQKIIEKTLVLKTKGYDGFGSKVTVSNKGDDLYFQVEVIFP